MPKTSQLQIRVSAEEKKLIKAAAKRANLDMSTWVLQTVLSQPEQRFRKILFQLHPDGKPAVMAGLIDFLAAISAIELTAIKHPEAELKQLSPYLQNYVCALIEQRANQVGVSAPNWTRHIPPLLVPQFGTDLRSLRPYLLFSAPVAFRQRNLFIDSALGARV